MPPIIYKATKTKTGDVQLTHGTEMLTVPYEYEEALANEVHLLNGLYYIKWD